LASHPRATLFFIFRPPKVIFESEFFAFQRLSSPPRSKQEQRTISTPSFLQSGSLFPPQILFPSHATTCPVFTPGHKNGSPPTTEYRADVRLAPVLFKSPAHFPSQRMAHDPPFFGSNIHFSNETIRQGVPLGFPHAVGRIPSMEARLQSRCLFIHLTLFEKHAARYQVFISTLRSPHSSSLTPVVRYMRMPQDFLQFAIFRSSSF